MADPGAGDSHERGMATRRAVLGDAHVDRSAASATPFDAAFQRHITARAWGDVWSDPQIDRRTRSLLTIALLAALGHHEELAMHVRATRNTGATPEDIREALMHVAVYGGVPAANRAFAIAKQTLAGMAAETTENGGDR
ncbi:MAG: 4-carboxymuconolactone decarboxylase [Rhodospirillaceae bacterium]|nr:4-carboxymuconolactone decarboxylase [Rhodospirillaceae bacterium]